MGTYRSAQCGPKDLSGRAAGVVVGSGRSGSGTGPPGFIRRCEILDYWHALEYAWEFCPAALRRRIAAIRPVGSRYGDLNPAKSENPLRRLTSPSEGSWRDDLGSLILITPESPTGCSMKKSAAGIRVGWARGKRVRTPGFGRPEELERAGALPRYWTIALILRNDNGLIGIVASSHARPRLRRKLSGAWIKHPAKTDGQAMLRDTLAALEQLPAVCARFRR